jgi:hypothetical protein
MLSYLQLRPGLYANSEYTALRRTVSIRPVKICIALSRYVSITSLQKNDKTGLDTQTETL